MRKLIALSITTIGLIPSMAMAIPLTLSFSDPVGDNAGSIDPMDAARIAKTLGIRVYAIGVIQQGARTVDAQALTQMAELTGGRYFPAENEQSLQAIYASIDQLEKSRIKRSVFASYDEYAVYFLAGALGLLAFELVLRNTLWRQAT